MRSITRSMIPLALLFVAAACDGGAAPPAEQVKPVEEAKPAPTTSEVAKAPEEPVAEAEPTPAEPEAAEPVVVTELNDQLAAAPADSKSMAIGSLQGDSSGSLGGLGLRGTGRGGGGVGHGTIGGIGYGSGKGSSGYSGGRGQLGNLRARGPMPSRPQIAVEQDKVSDSDDFKGYGVNPMVSTTKDKLSTFSIDVDTGAYTIARRQLESGALPASSSVRVEEYVNYFAYNYPAPAKEAFAVSMEAAPSPFEATPGRYLLRVGVQGKRVEAKDRKPLHLTFLVDVSGSMSSVDKLPLAQRSLKILTNTLREGDTVSMVTYAGNTRVVLPATDAAYKGRILAAIDDLNSGGGTAMGSGMELAYKQALSTYKKGHVNRVIVLSDGDANIGNTGHPQILKSIKSYVDKGVTLSTIGFGMGNYKDTMMEQLANKGNGNYYYVDSQKEANKVFGEQASGTLEVIAKDVKLQVEFDPDKVSEYRLVGYENRDIADKDFRNDKVDAGEIGAGHTVTAFYEVVFKGEPSAGFATVRVRHKAPEGSTASEQAFVVTAGDMKAKVADASKDFQFGASVVAFAEILRKSPYAKGLSLALVEELATSSSSPNQKDRQEFIELVKKARTLFKG